MTLYAGLDVSDKPVLSFAEGTTHVYVVDGDGAVVCRDVVASGPVVLAKWLKRHVLDVGRVVLETGVTVTVRLRWGLR
jgi:transposase